MRYNAFPKVLIIIGIAIVITGFTLHKLAPKHYGLYHQGIGLWSRTIMPALTYGMTFILVGIAYSRVGHTGSIVSMSVLLILSNSGFAFAIHDLLTTPYAPELAFEVYFFIAQTLTYPWIMANIAGTFYFLHMLKRQKQF